MKIIDSVLLGFVLIGGAIPQTVLSNTIFIENASGEKIELGIDANDRFLDVLNQIQSYFQENRSEEKIQQLDAEVLNSGLEFHNTQWSLDVSRAGLIVQSKKKETQWRNYDISVSKKEKEDISYIVKTLGFGTLLGIGSETSSLKKAGKRIDHVHPLRFLMTVFTEEELKAGIASIKGQSSWVKDGFFDGLIDSLKEEAARNNINQFVDNFAKSVKIDSDLIYPSIKQGDWKEFIDILIDKIPRETNPNRLNM